MIKYDESKYNRLIDIILDKDNGDLSIRKDAITELKNKPMTQSMLNKIARAERLYGIPDDLQGLVDFKNKQRIEDVGSLIDDLEKNLSMKHIEDFCLYLGIPEDSSFYDIVDKAHVAVRNGKGNKPRAVTIIKQK